ATTIWVVCFMPTLEGDTAGRKTRFVLYDGAGSIGWLTNMDLGDIATGQNSVPALLVRRLTPSAAAHTYSLRAFNSAAGATALAGGGAGGSGNVMPGFIAVVNA